jgi:C1A family cysteine protease
MQRAPSKIGRKYGWKPDLPHFGLKFEKPAGVVLQKSMDRRPQFPAVYDQEDLGSCTANALAGVIEFDLMRQKLPVFTPSRLFIYYQERVEENSVASDSGATLHDGVQAVATWGVPPETVWPYDTVKFATLPSNAAYEQALKFKAVSYMSINQSLNDMKACLVSGYGFVFGFTVYESFESAGVASTGVVPMPENGEQTLGGHAVVCVGYNDGPKVVNGIPAQHFVVRNSWGSAWGVQGYAFFPYAYLTNGSLCDDLWKVTAIA